MATLEARVALRRDTAANWTSNNPTLLEGEVGLETDTTRFKFGDGTTAWNSLSYYDSRNYRVYIATLVGAFSAAPPTATIIENTLGGTPVWSYQSSGLYRVTLAGAFPVDNTVCFITAADGFYTLSATPRNGGGDYVEVQCVRVSTGASENSGFYGKDSIEIRVYD